MAVGRLLAEAVNRYVAELEKLAATTARRPADPGAAPGRRRDGVG